MAQLGHARDQALSDRITRRRQVGLRQVAFDEFADQLTSGHPARTAQQRRSPFSGQHLVAQHRAKRAARGVKLLAVTP